MTKALGNSYKASNITMKISKKDGNPILSIIMEMNNLITVTQDVPIIVLNSNDNKMYEEPSTDPPEIIISFPSVELVKHFFTTMKATDSYLYLKGNKEGKLIFKAISECMTIETKFGDLKVQSNNNNNNEIEVKIDSKHFSKILGYSVCSPTNVICCLGNDSIVFHCIIIQNAITLTYFLAVLESN